MIKPQKEAIDAFVIQNCILSNSITVKVGDAMIINSAAPQFVTVNGINTTGAILGTVIAINGSPTGGNPFPQVNSITTAANNQTVGLISVDIMPSQTPMTYIADLDAVAGTTSGSNYLGYFAMLSGTAGQLHESSFSASTPKQFLSYGVNPGNSSQVIGTFSTVAKS
jgi:hypothetical protein